MKKYAVIVAGGAGVRMGGVVPKQFLPLNGRPVLWYTLDAFLRAFPDLEIILVVPAAYLERARTLVLKFAEERRIQLVVGGDSRFHSVRNGLGLVVEDKDPAKESSTKEGSIIFVHDGVRCLVSGELIQRCYDQAVRLGSAIPVIGCRDSVRLVGEEGTSKTIDRDRIKLVQTPQTFRSDILLEAYKMDHREAFTDEATVVEIAGKDVHLIDGELTNIKITTQTDMILAGQLLGNR
jgi:2-C-methyl-D-erythritol 4-phosphate cytidylyltransferase